MPALKQIIAPIVTFWSVFSNMFRSSSSSQCVALQNVVANCEKESNEESPEIGFGSSCMHFWIEGKSSLAVYGGTTTHETPSNAATNSFQNVSSLLA